MMDRSECKWGLCVSQPGKVGESQERFLRHRFQRKPLVSHPGMHHGTCVMHVPESLTRGCGKTFPTFPAHAQPVTFRISQEGHRMTPEWFSINLQPLTSPDWIVTYRNGYKLLGPFQLKIPFLVQIFPLSPVDIRRSWSRIIFIIWIPTPDTGTRLCSLAAVPRRTAKCQ